MANLPRSIRQLLLGVFGNYMAERIVMSKEAKGLLRLAMWLFYLWGILVTAVGILRLLNINRPDSEFVTVSDWLRFSVFQVTYGLACIGVGYLIYLYLQKKWK